MISTRSVRKNGLLQIGRCYRTIEILSFGRRICCSPMLLHPTCVVCFPGFCVQAFRHCCVSFVLLDVFLALWIILCAELRFCRLEIAISDELLIPVWLFSIMHPLEMPFSNNVPTGNIRNRDSNYKKSLGHDSHNCEKIVFP